MKLKSKYENYKTICCYCETELINEDITKEHLIASSKDGNNTSFNVKACCLTCNRLRGDKSLTTFRVILRKALNKGVTYKHYTIEQTKTIIKNTYVWEKYIKQNYEQMIN